MTTLVEIKNKKVFFYGLGLETRSLIDFLCQNEYLKTVDFFDQQEVTADFAVPLNVCSERDLLDYDIVFKSPGVSRYSPLIQQAIAAGVQVLSPNQLFFELNQSIKICITGSKGKSTFSKLIFELLEACDMKVILGGNIGVPLMNLVSEKSDLAVIELSSYQLADLTIAPEYAILTSLFPEHFNWHLSEANYFQDKLSIFTNAKNKYASIGLEDKLRSFSDIVFAKDLTNQLGLDISKSYFQAQHLSAALNLCLTVLEELFRKKQRNILEYKDTIQAVISGFEPLPHRLELVYENTSYKIINDSISTTQESALVALAGQERKQTVLILGGFDRKLSYQNLISELQKDPPAMVICLPETGERIYEAIKEDCNVVYVESLEEAVKSATVQLESMGKGVMLFSPGASSYNCFRNFIQRGEHFKELIKEISIPALQ